MRTMIVGVRQSTATWYYGIPTGHAHLVTLLLALLKFSPILLLFTMSVPELEDAKGLEFSYMVCANGDPFGGITVIPFVLGF